MRGGGRRGIPCSLPSRLPPPRQPLQQSPTHSPASHQKTFSAACLGTLDFLSPAQAQDGLRVGPDTLRQTWLLAALDLLQESQVLPTGPFASGVVIVLANYKGIFLVSRQVIEKSYPLARVRSCYPTNHS